MHRWLPITAVALAAGCTGSGPTFQGEDMEPYFPFPENMDCRWEFRSEDQSVPYKLIAEIVNEERIDDVRRYTVEYTKDCVGDPEDCVEGDFVRSMVWSLQGIQGVNIHSVETPDGLTEFDPSLRFVEKYMKRGDTVENQTNGTTYTTTLEEFGDCPVLLDWDQCAKLVLESAAGPDRITGTYWAINDFNLVAMDFDDDELPVWRLENHITLEQ